MSKEYMDVPFEVKADSLTDDGTFSGYASMFMGEPDSYGDVVKKGAFNETIQAGGRNGFGVAMLWAHDSHAPIGVWKDIHEDSKGLAVTGKLTRGVQKADEAYLLIKDKAVQGLSIGYDVGDYEIVEDKKNNTRTRILKKVTLYEISPVVFPALVRAQITNVKEAIRQAKNERELETALREAGLSHSLSRDIVFMCKPYLREVKDKKGMKDVLSILTELNKAQI
jgi:uncharacterized protein